MLKIAVSIALVMTCAEAAHAAGQRCYPRMGTVSSQYEGQCPNSQLKWVVFENDLGAFGRNCSDEPWSYSRAEKAYYNHKNQTTLPMTDCTVTR